jgi:hypothetical protein
MSAGVLRALEHVHGHLAWLSTLALYHPAILLRRPRRRALGAALSATVLVTATAALGALVYPAYRALVKPALFAASPAIGNLFERKENLGVGAVALAWAGLVHHLFADRRGADARAGNVAFVAFAGAAAFATLAAVMGVIVSVERSF